MTLVGRAGYGWDVSDIRAGKTQSEGADKASCRCIGKVFPRGLHAYTENRYNRTASEGVV